MSIKFQLFSLFLFTNTLFALSQIEAVVVDIENNPLEDVEVFFVDQNLLLKTNENGVFIIESSLPDNSYLEL
ncbi:MAG: hypothetical protein CBD51_006445, partial [Flavobacteriales bacterium TMED191]